jgi:hypothetical protein
MKPESGEPRIGPMVENLHDRLFLPWNIEGEPNLEYLNMLVEIDVKMREDPKYIAVGGFGSQFKGYAKANSDSDMLIVMSGGKDDKDRRQEEISFYNRFPQTEKPIGGMIYHYDDLLGSLENPEDEYFPVMVVLAHFLLGKKEELKKLKDLLVEKHNKLAQDLPKFAFYNFRTAIEHLIHSDMGILVKTNEQGQVAFIDESMQIPTMDKIQRRSIEAGGNEINAFNLTSDRVALWVERLNGILGTDYKLNFLDYDNIDSLDSGDFF